MARSTKIKHQFEISKNQQKQGAWLLISVREVPEARDDQGRLVIAIEDIESAQSASAWTTQAAAKRAAAASVGRSRLMWSAPNTDDETFLVAEYVERVSS